MKLHTIVAYLLLAIKFSVKCTINQFDNPHPSLAKGSLQHTTEGQSSMVFHGEYLKIDCPYEKTGY